jgi:hypothetical protein
MPTAKHKILKIICLIFGLIIFFMSCYKASNLAFTHDEAFTYNTYVNKSFVGIVTFEEPISANNHFLNSIAMKLMTKFFGVSPFTLRIPNLIGHLFFLIFSFLLCSKLKNNVLFICGFFLLNTNCFFNEFFSLARGYGIANGLLMAHFYFLYRFILLEQTKRNYMLMVTCLFLATYANLTIIYYGLSLVATFIFSKYFGEKYFNVRSFKLPSFLKFNIIVLVLSLTGILYPIVKLVQRKQLYFGGDNNFFDDTIGSLVKMSIAGASYPNLFYVIIFYLVSLLIILLSCYFVFNLFKKRLLDNFGNVITGLFVLMILIQNVSVYLTNGKFLIDRTAAFLLPFLILSFIFLIDEFYRNYFIVSLPIIITALATVHFFKFVSFDKTFEWSGDADNEKILHDLKMEWKKNNLKSKLKLGIDWIYEPSINFYINTTIDSNFIMPVDRDGFTNKEFDYFIVGTTSQSFFKDTISYQLINYYPISNSYLYKNIK